MNYFKFSENGKLVITCADIYILDFSSSFLSDAINLIKSALLVKKKTSTTKMASSSELILLILSLLISVCQTSGLCPHLCTCDDDKLIVECIHAGLDVMPNTLNPMINTIIYKNNEFLTVDVSLR